MPESSFLCERNDQNVWLLNYGDAKRDGESTKSAVFRQGDRGCHERYSIDKGKTRPGIGTIGTLLENRQGKAGNVHDMLFGNKPDGSFNL